jgi:hypothetical protein
MNAGNRAGVDGFLDLIFRAALGFYDLGLLFVFPHLENFGTDFNTGAAGNTLRLVNIDCPAHDGILSIIKLFAFHTCASIQAGKKA